ncbi:MAG: UDP-N-acetylmuramoyl-L-alanyl-D-glutamate--2,6-diaminopimelate ligase [Acidimicrobiia bacterium]|nr:UDP-N-acetylmuramoyl-L-alanyl-D-glutamate--2,6-diaminopimelate ligase [Acidimicrobiia bacterium]NNL27280.1 UDP-N-acetylmuramoyl-L-alanyl-D-glutamate--2,6-diaminopimelate ligase [Acidimicrobiia bacterium]
MNAGLTAGELSIDLNASVVGDPGVLLTDVTHDSRSAAAGSLFVAIRGLKMDGHAYVNAAIASGASAVCVEEAPAASTVPVLVVRDSRKALGPASSAIHGHPSRKLSVVGVTGTNGKTTVTHMVGSIVDAANGVAGVIGTVGGRMGETPIDLGRTTPEASDFQRLLRRMVEAGVTVVATEVSSHAMTLHRVDGTRFSIVAFTGLSQDHLDFHGDMDEYFRAKATLFDATFGERAVINVDDAWGAKLRDLSDLDGMRVGVDVFASHHEERPGRSVFTLNTPGGSHPVRLPMGGRFNVTNAVIAAAISLELGFGVEPIVAGLENMETIPGRFEQIPDKHGRHVFVDYAHTPDGIAQVIASAAQLSDGRVLAVVGAAGDRDTAKRPLMGRAAATANIAVITSDNPRSERPEDIIAEVIGGIPAGASYHVDPDRRAAIRWAIEQSGPQDIVLVLGKGHESGQEFAHETVPFDDRVVTAEELAAWGSVRSHTPIYPHNSPAGNGAPS